MSAGGGNVEQGFVNVRYGAGDDQLSYRVFGGGFTRGPSFHPEGRNLTTGASGRFRLDPDGVQRDTVTLLGTHTETLRPGARPQLLLPARVALVT